MKQQRASQAARNDKSYRNRYKAFLDERHSGGRSSHSQDGAKGQGVINLAIFVALFIAILTLFGFGLSRIDTNRSIESSGRAEELFRQKQSATEALTPPPTVYPSGHSEIKTKQSPMSEGNLDSRKER